MRYFKVFFIAAIFSILFLSSFAYADCRGCCAGHGGIICLNGVTVCVDGTPLSQNCINKGCRVCAGPTPSVSSETIKIANFNIQVFGRSKAKKEEVMEILAETITQLDIVAIQEIRDKTGTAINKLELVVDDLGANYDFIIGPRLGRTSSKEQYAYFYKTDTITPGVSYTYDDSANDIFHREPYIAQFSTRNGNFDFILVTVHTDPDDATSEIYALADIVADARTHFPEEKDVIVLGDLNADCSYFDEDKMDYALRGSHYTWLIENDRDTNVASGSDCTYDRIIITSSAVQDYAGSAEVFRFDQNFDLDCEPKEVSDHYPVFAEFRVDGDTD